MTPNGTTRRVDDEGRVSIPREIREGLDLETGTDVRFEVRKGTVGVRPTVPRSKFVESMRGCISAETKSAGAPPVAPDELKADWTSDLPNDR